MRHKRVTVCNVYACTYYRRKEVYGILQTKKKEKRRGGGGHDSFARGKQFSECSLYGSGHFYRDTRRKQKKLSFPLTLIRPRYYQRKAIYHNVSIMGEAQRTYTDSGV